MSAKSKVALPDWPPGWPARWHTLRFRLLGLLPLIFFLSRFIHYFRVGTPSHIQWSCHISNLVLAIGMFFANPLLIRVATFWLILGLFPWIGDMIFTGIVTPVSVFSHLGGFLLSLVAIREVRAKNRSWVPALLFFLVLQQISRLTTPADLNVNIAHHAYGPWKDLFDSYWKYWLAGTALTVMTLWLTEVVLLRLFPHQSKTDHRSQVPDL